MAKKTPLRMCVGCREMFPKKELLRIVRSPEGEVSMDLTGRKSGRGAYVCRSAECLGKAIRHRQLERALETKLTDEVAQALRATLDALPPQPTA